jgi:prepilin-type N-terminal cleavage/methylation domain-containing protein
MFKTMRTRDERGFTLVELLIVIAIIAILAAIAIPQFAQYQERAIRASMQSDAKNVATMEAATFGDTQSYATVNDSPAGGAFSVGSQPATATKGNIVSVNAVAPPTNTYVVYVYNPSAGTGSTSYTMDSSGGMAFVSGGPLF